MQHFRTGLLVLAALVPAACGGGGAEIDPAFDARRFGPPQFLEDRADRVFDAKVVVHPLGHGLSAVFVDRAGGGREVEARLRRTDGTFGPPESLYVGPTTMFGDPLVSAGGHGAIVLREQATNVGDASLLYYDAALGSWRPRIPLEAGVTLDTEAVAGAIDAAGNVVVAAEEIVVSSQAHRLTVRRYTASGMLEAAHHFDQHTGPITQVRAATNDAGVAAVAWTQSVGGVSSAFASVYRTSSGWSAPEEIDGVAGAAFVRGLEVGPDGHVVALLSCQEGAGVFSRRFRMAAHMPPASATPGWQPSVPLHADLADPSDQFLRMAADGQCVVVYAMATDAAGAGFVRAVRFSAPDGVGPTVPLSAPMAPAIADTFLRAEVNAAGDLVAAWTEAENGVEVMRAAVVSRSGAVATSRLLRELPDTHDLSSPAIGVDPRGGGTVVWKELDPDASSPAARRHAARHLSAEGEAGELVLLTASPGDRSQSPRIEMDDGGLGTLYWRHDDSNTGHTDARLRTFR